MSYVAVFAAAIVSVALGALWYSPLLFGRMWESDLGPLSPERREAMRRGVWRSYALAFLASLLMAYVLAHFVEIALVSSAGEAATLGFWIWLGFIATVLSGSVLWEGKKARFYAITAGYYLLAVPFMGAVLALLG